MLIPLCPIFFPFPPSLPSFSLLSFPLHFSSPSSLPSLLPRPSLPFPPSPPSLPPQMNSSSAPNVIETPPSPLHLTNTDPSSNNNNNTNSNNNNSSSTAAASSRLDRAPTNPYVAQIFANMPPVVQPPAEEGGSEKGRKWREEETKELEEGYRLFHDLVTDVQQTGAGAKHQKAPSTLV